MPLSPEATFRDIGRRIAELRAEHGFTQQEVADELGISSRYVQALEAGRVNASVRALVEVANVFREPLATFLIAPKSRVTPRPGRPKKARLKKKKKVSR